MRGPKSESDCSSSSRKIISRIPLELQFLSRSAARHVFGLDLGPNCLQKKYQQTTVVTNR